jgi:TetR/AcrR family transcriptional regulator, cholesterol catabolism regulator
MPSARVGIERAEKLDEILGVAQRRLLEGGYDHMSVAAIARELGLSQNTIYWYFPSKDELLAAAARRVFEQQAGSKPSQRNELAKVLWAAAKMSELAPLRGLVRERAPFSAPVAALERDLEGWVSTLLTSGILTSRHPDARIAATAFRATVEGTVALGLHSADRRRVITWSFERIEAGLRQP